MMVLFAVGLLSALATLIFLRHSPAILVALVVPAICPSVHAEIGWTLEECRQFYGKETELSSSVGRDFSFKVGGLCAIACFMADTDAVGQIYYFKDTPNWGKRLTAKEIDALLRLNGDGIEWKPEGLGGKPHEEYVREMGRYLLWTGYDKSGHAAITAEYLDDSTHKEPRPTLTISTIDYANAEQARIDESIEKEREKAAAKGD
jgi:hypothetical protein